MGKKYPSVQAMVDDLGDPGFAEEFRLRQAEHGVMNRLIVIRVARGLTQSDVAERCGFSALKISRLENTKDERIKLGDLVRYAGGLGLDATVTFTSRHELPSPLEGEPL